MTLQKAAFAIPGDINTVTGGYIYERRLLEGLRAQGRDVEHIQLGASFPDPSKADMAAAATRLLALPPDRPLILDGLVYGSIDTSILRDMRAPIVAMIHHPLALENGLTQARRDVLFTTERDNLAQATHVLVPSPHTAAVLAEDYAVPPDRITIARPGTDRPLIASSPSAPPLILSVGIQCPRKGHDILLRALQPLLHLDWQAVVVGGVHDEDHAHFLADLHASLGLQNRVHFVGRIPAQDLARLYSSATLFALATRFEGYGIVFDEALSYGLPIVTCQTGAVPDTVPQDAGLLAPPDDPDAFSHALGLMLSDHALRLGKAEASRRAGLALPAWSDTAKQAGLVLDNLHKI